ncbi:uncharacterized protein LOC130726810 [Lotus japonicus]|uniref:uncharacterized protein LOC130726810 n=1 Tax=Lotus japonicus TaxID=34305 RepID=UPI00258D8537|nr:uncharacterized protein LOC130726810 [Lotus japonicus]
MAAEVAVFADTNLGTRIAFNAPRNITAGALKRDFEKVHFTCLPEIGEIQVNGLTVKRKRHFYYLPDSLSIKYVFPGTRGTWFLHVEVRPLKDVPISLLPHDAAIDSKHRDLVTNSCENKASCKNEEKRVEEFHRRGHLSEEHETTDHVLKEQKEKGNSHENCMQNAASELPERCSCRFGDMPICATKKSQCVMPENKGEKLDEMQANSMQGSLSKMSTQVISVTGIINKYFSSFNVFDNVSCSSDSDVTSRAVRSEIEVQSNTTAQSCLKRQIDSLPQFTPKTPPHVLHAPSHVELVSKNVRGGNRRSKVGKSLLVDRRSKVGKRLLVASQSLVVSTAKHSPTLSFCRFKDKKLLKKKSQKGSVFSISESDD